MEGVPWTSSPTARLEMMRFAAACLRLAGMVILGETVTSKLPSLFFLTEILY
jgi:hypothetical protein